MRRGPEGIGRGLVVPRVPAGAEGRLASSWYSQFGVKLVATAAKAYGSACFQTH
jgi:hypothetical protein